jgi:hypothetical protein
MKCGSDQGHKEHKGIEAKPLKSPDTVILSEAKNLLFRECKSRFFGLRPQNDKAASE